MLDFAMVFAEMYLMEILFRYQHRPFNGVCIGEVEYRSTPQ